MSQWMFDRLPGLLASWVMNCRVFLTVLRIFLAADCTGSDLRSHQVGWRHPRHLFILAQNYDRQFLGNTRPCLSQDGFIQIFSGNPGPMPIGAGGIRRLFQRPGRMGA